MIDAPVLTLTLGAAWRTCVYTAECKACHYYARVDLQAIAEQLGQHFPLIALRKRLCCSMCGHRDTIIAVLDKSHSISDRHRERWPFEYDDAPLLTTTIEEQQCGN